MKTCNSAPSNIALIKYMGKIEGLGNRPTNASISYSLEHLRTFVELEQHGGREDVWEPLVLQGSAPLKLSDGGREKFLKHFRFLKEKWEIEAAFKVRSANTFPSDCGLASSASSFAALTKTAAEHFQSLRPQPWGADSLELSKLSRQGSGSSCRSFFSPWAIWRSEGAESVDLPAGLHHAVIVLESGVKQVSSSEAHKRVITSPRFQGRVPRAEQKLEDLISVIRQEKWKWAFEIIWDEFWDMHELFHTSQPGFQYMTPECREVLQFMERQWKKKGHGPWITLDAGPNIHLLFHREDLALTRTYVEDFKKFTILTSWGRE
ncbi:MAG: diphosphomevalonate/mevalonate 3,5-bisphosphate decarboxylase family protein [Bdellovibrionales bacterium]